MSPDEAANRDVLIVDGDQVFPHDLAAYLVLRGYRVTVTMPAEMFKVVNEINAGVVLCDIDGPDVAGVNLPAQLLNVRPDLTCVVMASRSNRRRTVTPFSDGEFGFINKCDGFDAALQMIDTCFKHRELHGSSETGQEMPNHVEEAIEEADHAKLEFLSKVSHELRTPLNAIIGFSELIMRNTLGPLGNEQYRTYIEDIHLSGRHLLDVINDILDFAKSEAGKLSLQESEVDLHAVIGSCERFVGPRARDAGITLTNACPANVPKLWCDHRKLRQMLLNLIVNAVKFTPAGGRVDINVSQGPQGLILTIADTGIGIAQADLVRVFKPFVQVEKTLSRRQEGAGLGLPLVKAMIELHGGSIELESQLNEGTISRLAFPPERVIATGVEMPARGDSIDVRRRAL